MPLFPGRPKARIVRRPVVLLPVSPRRPASRAINCYGPRGCAGAGCAVRPSLARTGWGGRRRGQRLRASAKCAAGERPRLALGPVAPILLRGAPRCLPPRQRLARGGATSRAPAKGPAPLHTSRVSAGADHPRRRVDAVDGLASKSRLPPPACGCPCWDIPTVVQPLATRPTGFAGALGGGVWCGPRGRCGVSTRRGPPRRGQRGAPST